MSTFTLGRLFGIPIRVTLAFVYVAGVIVLLGALGDPSNGLRQLVVLIFLLTSLLLHELGHALVARRLGIRVLDITLWHLGGMARMTEIPESPRVEALVAGAGPAVNLAMAAAAAPLLLLGPALGPIGLELVSTFVSMNVLLGGLNLLPAFPMDGGRLLRAFLATRKPYLVATENAVQVGKWIAVGMVLVGTLLYQSMGFLLAVLVAGFVWFAGAKELVQVRVRHTGSPFGGAFTGQFGQSFGGAFGNLFGGGFGGPTQRAEPAETTSSSTSPSESVTPPSGGARRPEAGSSDAAAPRGGFTDEDVRRLESYRGPLRRRDS